MPRSHLPFARRRVVATAITAAAAAVAASPAAMAQAAADPTLDAVVVTATRRAEKSFDVPASIDTIDAATIRVGQPMVNLSETLVRVPGIYAANRGNYAQDLQISSRGFGARAAFGVRGVRLYQDNIPATMPDGQGQTGSFSLLSAERIEVLRGPFSTLYGNASGGVVSLFTEQGTPEPVVTANASAGSYGTWVAGVKATGTMRDAGYVVAASRFSTDGYREHSAARRDLANAKLTFRAGESTRVTIVGAAQYQPETQDPLGLTRAQWEDESATGRSGGDPVQHPEDDRPGAGRAVGRPVDRRRVVAAGDRLRRTPGGAPVPRAARHGAHVVGRRRQPRPRFRRHRREGQLERARPRAGADGDVRRRLRSPARGAAGLRQQQRQPRRAAPRPGRHRRQQRRLPRGDMGVAPGAVADGRRPRERGAVRLRRPLHRHRQSGRQRLPQLHQHQPGARRDVSASTTG